ncbi:MAG: enoyl-CoA hydratase-related protein [Peptococcaceae bacterium]|jgi:enoyl-CoA hydratase|nr:enoyl-CoA hydratase-related protein [Peptococcaceae bacterium]
MEYTAIILSRENGVGLIQLNRPSKLNALNETLLAELKAALVDLAAAGDVKAVVLYGGEKLFGAGADLKMITARAASTVEAHLFFGRELGPVYGQLSDMGKPVIAAVDGYALGGACELALACDLRVAGETAVFGLPEVNLGLLPGGGGTQRLPRLVGPTRAKEMLFTGESIDAQEAYRIGLVNKVVPAGKVLEEALALAEKIARKPAFAVRMIKSAVDTGAALPLDAALRYEGRCFEMLFSTADAREGVSAFLDRRKPRFSDR